MKYSALIGILFLFVSVSCQKVIDLKLKDSESKYVLKGQVTAGDSVHTLSITKSIDFDESNVFPGVPGATVVLSDNFGNAETLTDLGDGNYETVNLLAVAGRTYTIDVSSDGNDFQATSTIPALVNFNDIEFLESNFFGDSGFAVIPKFTDPAGVKNNYLSRYFNPNDLEEDSDFIISDDSFSDGLLNEQPFFGDWLPSSGDTVVFLLWGIDDAVYKYYFSFFQNTSGNSGAPANPVTNWNNDALGYFSAQNLQTFVKVVP